MPPPTWPIWSIHWVSNNLMSASDRLAVFSQSSLRTLSPISWSRCWLKISRAADMKKYENLIFGIVAWIVAVIIFFPIFWMAITAFKTEQGAYSPDLIFVPTLDSFKEVFSRSNYLGFMMNSIYVSVGSTLVCLIFAIPAAYKMSFFPTPKTQSTLLWMLSTKMMPAVGVLVPIYFLFRTFGLLDTVVGLIIIYTLINLPITIWMSYTSFCEIPAAILEAGRVDGASVWHEPLHPFRSFT